MHLGICTAPHPLQYGTPPPPSPMPHLLQEMAGRWCHWSVSIVLKIEVYDRIKSSSCSHSLVVVDKTSIDVYRHLEKSMKLHFWKKWHGTASKVLGIEGRLFFVFWSTPVREIATFAKVHFPCLFRTRKIGAKNRVNSNFKRIDLAVSILTFLQQIVKLETNKYKNGTFRNVKKDNIWTKNRSRTIHQIKFHGHNCHNHPLCRSHKVIA